MFIALNADVLPTVGKFFAVKDPIFTFCTSSSITQLLATIFPVTFNVVFSENEYGLKKAPLINIIVIQTRLFILGVTFSSF
jgi:hypothetical protein